MFNPMMMNIDDSSSESEGERERRLAKEKKREDARRQQQSMMNETFILGPSDTEPETEPESQPESEDENDDLSLMETPASLRRSPEPTPRTIPTVSHFNVNSARVFVPAGEEAPGAGGDLSIFTADMSLVGSSQAESQAQESEPKSPEEEAEMAFEQLAASITKQTRGQGQGVGLGLEAGTEEGDVEGEGEGEEGESVQAESVEGSPPIGFKLVKSKVPRIPEHSSAKKQPPGTVNRRRQNRKSTIVSNDREDGAFRSPMTQREMEREWTYFEVGEDDSFVAADLESTQSGTAIDRVKTPNSGGNNTQGGAKAAGSGRSGSARQTPLVPRGSGKHIGSARSIERQRPESDGPNEADRLHYEVTVRGEGLREDEGDEVETQQGGEGEVESQTVEQPPTNRPDPTHEWSTRFEKEDEEWEQLAVVKRGRRSMALKRRSRMWENVQVSDEEEEGEERERESAMKKRGEEEAGEEGGEEVEERESGRKKRTGEMEKGKRESGRKKKGGEEMVERESGRKKKRGEQEEEERERGRKKKQGEQEEEKERESGRKKKQGEQEEEDEEERESGRKKKRGEQEEGEEHESEKEESGKKAGEKKGRRSTGRKTPDSERKERQNEGREEEEANTVEERGEQITVSAPSSAAKSTSGSTGKVRRKTVPKRIRSLEPVRNENETADEATESNEPAEEREANMREEEEEEREAVVEKRKEKSGGSGKEAAKQAKGKTKAGAKRGAVDEEVENETLERGEEEEEEANSTMVSVEEKRKRGSKSAAKPVVAEEEEVKQTEGRGRRGRRSTRKSEQEEEREEGARDEITEQRNEEETEERSGRGRRSRRQQKYVTTHEGEDDEEEAEGNFAFADPNLQEMEADMETDAKSKSPGGSGKKAKSPMKITEEKSKEKESSNKKTSTPSKLSGKGAGSRNGGVHGSGKNAAEEGSGRGDDERLVELALSQKQKRFEVSGKATTPEKGKGGRGKRRRAQRVSSGEEEEEEQEQEIVQEAPRSAQRQSSTPSIIRASQSPAPPSGGGRAGRTPDQSTAFKAPLPVIRGTRGSGAKDRDEPEEEEERGFENEGEDVRGVHLYFDDENESDEGGDVRESSEEQEKAAPAAGKRGRKKVAAQGAKGKNPPVVQKKKKDGEAKKPPKKKARLVEYDGDDEDLQQVAGLYGLRRSGRTRVSPLEFWAGEHVVYKINEDLGVWHMEDVERMAPPRVDATPDFKRARLLAVERSAIKRKLKRKDATSEQPRRGKGNESAQDLIDADASFVFTEARMPNKSKNADHLAELVEEGLVGDETDILHREDGIEETLMSSTSNSATGVWHLPPQATIKDRCKPKTYMTLLVGAGQVRVAIGNRPHTMVPHRRTIHIHEGTDFVLSNDYSKPALVVYEQRKI